MICPARVSTRDFVLDGLSGKLCWEKKRGVIKIIKMKQSIFTQRDDLR